MRVVRFAALAAAAVLCMFVSSSSAMPIKSENGTAAVGRVDYPTKVYGIDVSQPVSQSDFECLINDGLEFVIVRAFRSDGVPDYNAPATLAAAAAAGMPHQDVYLFPCPTCGSSAYSQVGDMVNHLSGSDYGMIWLDIEGPQYWHNSASENQSFFKDLLSAAIQLHGSVGIYSSASQWDEIFGSGFTAGGNHALWYPHYDGDPSFGDFSPFGGFSRPSIKQFSDAGSKCGASYDINWYP